jgi:hypothetical protein
VQKSATGSNDGGAQQKTDGNEHHVCIIVTPKANSRHAAARPSQGRASTRPQRGRRRNQSDSAHRPRAFDEKFGDRRWANVIGSYNIGVIASELPRSSSPKVDGGDGDSGS